MGRAMLKCTLCICMMLGAIATEAGECSAEYPNKCSDSSALLQAAVNVHTLETSQEASDEKNVELATECVNTLNQFTTATDEEAETLKWHNKYYAKDVKCYWGWGISEIAADGIAALQKVHASWFDVAADINLVTESAYAGEGNTVVLKVFLSAPKSGVINTMGSAVFEFDNSGLINKVRWFWDYTWLVTVWGMYKPCAKKKALIEEYSKTFNGLQLHQSIHSVNTDLTVNSDVKTCMDMANLLHVNKNYNSMEWHEKHYTKDTYVVWGTEALGPVVADGIEAIQKTDASWYVPTPDLNMRVIRGFALEGNRVFIEAYINGIPGVKDAIGSAIFEMKDGLIKKGRWYWDYTYLLTQMGIYKPCEKKG